jgi:excisionase family DNA binding protein
VCIRDHHDGYIGWADYLTNEARLAANRTNTGARPPREGSALCQGIIACGSCGKPMRTNYRTGQRPSYECSSRADRLTTPTCRSVAASTVDDAVAERLLAALNPPEVALALAAADEVADRRHRVNRATELAVERARYEADRAERAFHAVEPENRLVARTLETRWETKLAALADAEHALEAATNTAPPLPSRAELERLTADLPALWHAPTTSNKDRKRLLRTLIADITLLPETDAGKARIGIRWLTGATDDITVTRATHPGTAKRSPSPAVAMVTRLGPTTPTTTLADLLNAAGLTTGTGAPFDVKAVQWIRHAYHVPAPNPYADGEISVADAAHRLGCSTSVVYDWIKTGKLAARRDTGNRLCIPWTEHVETQCRCRITESGHLNPAARRRTPARSRT